MAAAPQVKPDTRQVIPVPLGGMYAAGDLATMPQGFVPLVQNFVIRPNRFDMRDPVVWESTSPAPTASGEAGFGVWEDLSTRMTRFFSYLGPGSAVWLKDNTTGNWSQNSATSVLVGSRMLSYCNFNGILFFTTDDGSGIATQAPAAGAHSFDGLVLNPSPFNSAILPRCIVTFGSRLFLAGNTVTVTPLGTPLTNSYDWSNSANWKTTSVNVSFATLGSGVKVCRLAPTSTSASACSIIYNPTNAGLISVAANTAEQKYVWAASFRGNDPIYRVPYTIEWVMVSVKADTTAYNSGDMVTAAGFRYRCTTAGTTGTGVVLTTTVGATTTDGTAVFTCEGTDILQAYEDRAFTAADGWVPVSVECTVPPRTNSVYITPRLKFFNSSFTAVTTLSAIDISAKDGVADGAPRKNNRGQQWTLGDYRYPFFNKESAATATVNLEDIIWSEVGDPKTIRALNTYSPKEVAGIPTAMVVVGGNLLVFKRRALWQFSLTSDPDIPIQATGDARVGFGCLHPRAIDTLDDEVFWIGEDEVYRMRVAGPYSVPLPGGGEQHVGIPMPMCGEAMREEVMNKASNSWVENTGGPVPHASAPRLVVNRKYREIYVYTRDRILYVYNLDTARWVKWTLSTSLWEMGYNPITEQTYVVGLASGIGISAFSPGSNTGDSYDSGTLAAPVNIVHTITLTPFELSSPGRFDCVLDEIRFYSKVGASYTSENYTVNYSYDQGNTFPKTVTVNPASGFSAGNAVPMRFPAFQGGPSLTAQFTHTGKTGSSVLSLSRIAAHINIKKGEFPQVNPTAVSASL